MWEIDFACLNLFGLNVQTLVEGGVGSKLILSIQTFHVQTTLGGGVIRASDNIQSLVVFKSGTDFYVWRELWMDGDVRSNMSEVKCLK